MTAGQQCQQAAHRWYKYGRRQRRIILGYTAFAGLGLVFVAMIIGFIIYGMHSGDKDRHSDPNQITSSRGFMVSCCPCRPS